MYVLQTWMNESVFMPVPGYFYYYISVAQFEIWDGNTSSKFFLIAQECLGYPRSFVLPYEIWDYFLISMKDCFGI